MNAVSLEQTERLWLNAYLPGVPADIDAGIEDYPSLREVFLEHLHKFRDRVAYVSIGTEMTYADWEVQGIAFAAWLQAQGVKKGDRVALMMPNCLQYPI
ncbi:MAG: AMP-binding protein, partial [Pseudomonas sp.]